MDLVVPPTESLRFVAGELGKSGRNLEQIGAKVLGPNRFGVFFKTWRNAYLHVHDLGHIGKLEANLDSFKTPLSTRFSLSMEMSRLTRDGTANPSRENKFSGTHGDREIFIFPVQLTTSRIGNLARFL